MVASGVPLDQMPKVAVQLPERLHFLPYFLAAWVLSYVAPHLLTVVIELLVRVALVTGSVAAPDVGTWIVWLGVLPLLYAWAQWLLMRRCLSSALPWAVATFVGTLLARLALALIPDPPFNLVADFPQLLWVFTGLRPLLGTHVASTALAVLPAGLAFGVATSVPQAIVLPGSLYARIAWISVMIPTEYASTVVGESLYLLLYQALPGASFEPGVWTRLFALSFVPRLCAWLLVSVVSGSMMYVILRRRAGTMGDQLLTRFD